MTGNLFRDIVLPATGPKRLTFKRPQHPIWTENKAKLIERYLYYFVMVTKHGAYIDGFAGPGLNMTARTMHGRQNWCWNQSRRSCETSGYARSNRRGLRN